MSDDKMKVGLELEVKASGEDQLKKIDNDLQNIERRAKAIAASIRAAAGVASNPGRVKSGADPVRAARDALGIDRDRLRVLKLRMGYEAKERLLADAANQKQARESDRAFRLRYAFNSRMLKQQAAEQQRADRAQAAAQARQAREQEQSFRRSMRFNSAMARQRAADERATERDRERNERARVRAEALRVRLRDREERRAERETAGHYRDARSYGSRSTGHAHDAYTRIARPIGRGAAVAAGAGALAARTGISARMDTDTAETNLKIFSDQSAEQIKAARRGWLDIEAIRNGLTIAGGLNAYGEVLKSGMKSPVENTKTLMGAVSALELDLKDTTKLAGLIDRNYGAASTPAKIKSALNAIAVAAREDPTQAPEIVEGMKRGFGVLSMGNMTPEELAALVSGGQSVGIQPGKAGTFIATLGKQLSSGANRFLDPKNRKELNFATSKLGFGNSKAMAQAFASDSTGTIMRVLEGMRSADPALRTSIASALSGNQWNDEDLQIVNGLDGLKSTLNAVRDQRNAGFLDEAARKRHESWLGQWNSTKSVVNRFWEAFGSGFDEILTAVNSFFLDAGNKFDFDKITGVVKQGLAGVKDALGISTWKDLIQGTFGGDLTSVGQQIRDFAKGFTEGVLSIGRMVKGFVTSIGGTGASAETLGAITGKIIALAAACILAAPVVTVIAGIASVIMTLATASVAAWSLMRASGLVGAAGAGGALGKLAGRAGAVGMAGVVGAHRGEISTFILKNVLPHWWQDALGWDKDDKKSQAGPMLSSPEAQKSLDGLREAIEGNSLIHKQSLDNSTGIGSLIHRTALTGSISTTANTVRSQIESLGSALRNGPNSSGSGRGGSWGGAVTGRIPGVGTPGQALGPGGLSGRGIIGGRGAVPGTGPGTAEAGPGATGGSRSWRNNNPGNIEYGPFAKSMGATGSDGRFAKFPSYDAGRKAQETLLFESKGYRDLTLSQAIRRWAPASENNVPAYIAAMGGGDGNKRMSEYTPEQRGKLLDAMQKHEGWKVGQGGRPYTPSAASAATDFRDAPGNSSSGGAVDVARKFMGYGENNAGRRALESFTGGNIVGRANAWCARFVNASLAAVGQKGTGSAVANSFLRWGQAVSAEMAQKGDIMVEHRNRGANNPGGHVGMATGNKRMRNGQLELEMISGNSSEQVQTTWEKASKVAVRRSMQAGIQQAAEAAGSVQPGQWRKVGPDESIYKNKTFNLEKGADGTWKKSEGPATASIEKDGAGNWKRSLGQNTPLGQTTPIRPVNTLPMGGGKMGGGGSSSSNINAPITINGAGQDPETVANRIQKHLQESMNRRTTDLSPTVV